MEFPAGVVAQKTNQNNFAVGTNFLQIIFSGSGYAISGNKITLGTQGIIDTSTTVGTNTLGLAMTLSGTSQNLTVNTSGETLNLSGVLDGGASMRKFGTGTVQLSGVNQYTGTTTVNDGILAVANAAALGSTANGTVVISGASVLIVGATSVNAEPLTLNGGGFSGLGALPLQVAAHPPPGEEPSIWPVLRT